MRFAPCRMGWATAVALLALMCAPSTGSGALRRIGTNTYSTFGSDTNTSTWILEQSSVTGPGLHINKMAVCPFNDRSGSECDSGTYLFLFQIPFAPESATFQFGNLEGFESENLNSFGYMTCPDFIEPQNTIAFCTSDPTRSLDASLLADVSIENGTLTVKFGPTQALSEASWFPQGGITFYIRKSVNTFPTINSMTDGSGVYLFPLAPNPAGTNAFTETTLRFGSVRVGEESEIQSAVLMNGGLAPLNIYNILTAGNFELTDNCPRGTQLGPQESCTLFITFKPTFGGLHNGSVTITHDAPSAQHKILVSGFGDASDVRLSASTLDFGSEPVSTSAIAAPGSPPQVIQVTNPVTTLSVGVSNVSVSVNPVTGHADFTATPGFDECIPDSSAVCEITVTAHPGLLGPAEATLTIIDSDTNQHFVILRTVGSSPNTSLEPSNGLFPLQDIGTVSSNTEDFTAFGLPFLPSDGFLVNTVPDGFAVSFSPVVSGKQRGSVHIITSISTGLDVTYLEGVGQGEGIEKSRLTLSPGVIDFGVQALNTTSDVETVQLTNMTDQGQEVNFASLTTFGNFAIYGPSTTCSFGMPLAAGESCSIGVMFTPATTGSHQGGITILSDDPKSPHTVALLGRGLSDGILNLSIGSMDFGDQVVGTTSPPQIVTLSNAGTTPLGIFSITKSGDYAETNDCPASLLVGNSCEFSVTFTPGAEGLRAGSLTITHDAAGSPQAAALLGNGIVVAGPTHLWSKRFGGISNELSTALEVDSSGNVLVTGWFTGTGNFGGADLASAGGSGDIFVAKYDHNGTHLWSKRFGGTSFDQGYALAVDSGDNVVVTGEFGGTINFGGSNLTSAGGLDIFVAKFSPSGTHLWSKRFGGTDFERGRSAAVDSSDNVVVAGRFRGTVNFGGGTLTSASISDFNIFLAKFSSNGTHVWSRGFGNTVDAEGDSVAVDSSGNVVLIASANSSLPVDFGGGPLDGSMFIAKFSADGIHVWSNGFDVVAEDVAVDSGGNVVVTGWFQGTVDVGGGPLTSAGGLDIFVAKFDLNGNHIWSRRFGDTPSDSGDSGDAITLDSSGNVIVTGSAGDIVDFGGGPLASAGSSDFFVAKFSSDGEHIGSKRFGGLAADVGVESGGNAVVTGWFEGTVDFGGGPLTSAGAIDILLLLVKLGAQPTVALNRTSLNFGDVDVGTASSTQTVKLTNLGNADLNIIDINLTGDYSHTTTCGSSLAPGANCEIEVTFAPTAGGTRNGPLSVASNAPGSPRTLPLTGTGIFPPPHISLSTPAIGFGKQVWRTTSDAHLVVLTNDGTGPLNISNIAITVGNSSDFGLGHDCGSSLAPSAACTLSLTFSPTAAGPRKSLVTITSNATGSPHKVMLTGTGVALSVQPASLTFPNKAIGSSSAPLPVTLTNLGSTPVHLWQVAVTGDHAGDFIPGNTCPVPPATLAGGANCIINVVFGPTGLGTRLALLQFSHDGGGSPGSVTLSGTGDVIIHILSPVPAEPRAGTNGGDAGGRTPRKEKTNPKSGARRKTPAPQERRPL